MAFSPPTGAESPGAVRKIMALSDKVRPHNPKIPVPSVTSPGQGRRTGPSSPRHVHGPSHPMMQSRMPPVRLTQESSSVVSLSNIPLRKPIRTGKMSEPELEKHYHCLNLSLIFSLLVVLKICSFNFLFLWLFHQLNFLHFGPAWVHLLLPLFCCCTYTFTLPANDFFNCSLCLLSAYIQSNSYRTSYANVINSCVYM